MYFSEGSRFGGTWGVGHDNECLGETRYHQKRKGGCLGLTVLVCTNPHRFTTVVLDSVGTSLELVLDDASKVRQVIFELQYPMLRNF